MNINIIESVFEDLSNDYPNLELVSDIKSGKEADVYLVSSNDKIFALKVFRQNTKFSSRVEYMELNSMKSRQRKAVMQRSKVGRSMTQDIWTQTEFDSMHLLYEAGASIPKPYANTNMSILMEYIGDQNSPAPRLADIRLNTFQAEEVFWQVYRNLEIFLDCGIVHGDFSPFNILYWQGRAILIDFPQMMRIKNNTNARIKLRIDIENLKTYFSGYLNYSVVNELNRLC
jgi:RIO kinase 1